MKRCIGYRHCRRITYICKQSVHGSKLLNTFCTSPHIFVFESCTGQSFWCYTTLINLNHSNPRSWNWILTGDTHYNDVIMSSMAAQITSLTIVYSTVCSGADQRKHQARATGLCAGNSPVTGEFPAQMASKAENVFNWWRHHVRWKCRDLLCVHNILSWVSLCY